MTEVLQARIDMLESHLAHQTLTIDELNEVVLAQREEIERLTRRLNKLAGRVDALEVQAPLPDNRPPPHY